VVVLGLARAAPERRAGAAAQQRAGAATQQRTGAATRSTEDIDPWRTD